MISEIGTAITKEDFKMKAKKKKEIITETPMITKETLALRLLTSLQKVSEKMNTGTQATGSTNEI